ncbi:hypothetical protein [Pseudomonas sp. BE134]|jgi:hypothetical protein|uniref:hypothetical protein n=1 Tax=Pseudomonas sp. BE134 TaxID=2817843 RepID=UPI00285B090A|nr:hypothetical protein [Pseudomonas sp. BE134]MDR6927591.1 hypothetical protein [Pseudomonas sp. BE134]
MTSSEYEERDAVTFVNADLRGLIDPELAPKGAKLSLSLGADWSSGALLNVELQWFSTLNCSGEVMASTSFSEEWNGDEPDPYVVTIELPENESGPREGSILAQVSLTKSGQTSAFPKSWVKYVRDTKKDQIEAMTKAGY